MNYKMQSINNGVYQQTSPTSSQNFHISWTMWTNRTRSRWRPRPHVSSADSSPYSCAAIVSASSPIQRAHVSPTLADSSYIFASFNLISLILTYFCQNSVSSCLRSLSRDPPDKHHAKQVLRYLILNLICETYYMQCFTFSLLLVSLFFAPFISAPFHLLFFSLSNDFYPSVYPSVWPWLVS